jgi:hypothetical protein
MAWARHQTLSSMGPLVAVQAADKDAEQDRQAVLALLRDAGSLHVLGADRLTKAAVASIADGSVQGVDARAGDGAGAVRVRFRIDSKERVVYFDLASAE